MKLTESKEDSGAFKWRSYADVPGGEFAVGIRLRDHTVFVSAVMVCMALGVDQIDWRHPVFTFDDRSMHYYDLKDLVAEHLEIFKEENYTKRSIAATRAILREVLAESQRHAG